MHSLAVVTIYRVFYKFLGLNQSFLNDPVKCVVVIKWRSTTLKQPQDTKVAALKAIEAKGSFRCEDYDDWYRLG